MIGSRNALNFAYALYLRLRADQSIPEGERKRIVRRWFVLTLLTGRSTGSFETVWDLDIRRIAQQGAASYLKQLEEAELSDGFWNVALPNALETTSTVSPYFQTFLAAQVKTESRGFLSRHISVKDMQEHSGDIHHVVPKDYLQKNGYPDRSDYNQVGNFALTETSINIAISNRPPEDYMAEVAEQIRTHVLALGEIIEYDDLSRNLRENALPLTLGQVTAATYREFLAGRRKLMAAKIRDYYELL
jgi:hypothetical protein